MALFLAQKTRRRARTVLPSDTLRSPCFCTGWHINNTHPRRGWIMRRNAFLVLGILLTCSLGFAGTADEDPDVYRLTRLFAQGVAPTPQQLGSAPYLICSWDSARRGEHAVDYKMFRLTFKSDHILLEEIREDN